jgi:hypothetical protein
MSPFKVEGKQAVCAGCGARIRNTNGDKIEHLTTPSRAPAAERRRQAIARKLAE